MGPAGTILGFQLHEQTNSVFCLNLFESDFGPLLPRIVTHTKKKNVSLTLTDITHFPCAPGSETDGCHRHLLTPPPPPPPRSPPPFRTSQSQTQTAPNFDSFVTTVPVRLSQAVQTEDIYRCVGDTDTHTMTHTLRIHVGPDPPALSPGFRHLDTNPQDPQRGTHSIVEPRHRDARGSETHTPETDPDTYRERRAKTQTEIQTCTLHKRTETHAQTKTHSATHTPDSQPEPQTPRRPDSVSHARHSPTPSQS